jgi:hypothetical protein
MGLSATPRGTCLWLIVHGDVAGVQARRGLSDWLDWMGFIDAGTQADWIDTSHFEPYATASLTRLMRMNRCTKKRAMAGTRSCPGSAGTAHDAGRLQARVQPNFTTAPKI